MTYKKVTEKLSFWDRHGTKFFYYGHIYAILCGINAIDYVPTQKSHPFLQRISFIYSFIMSFCLVVILPIYFGTNYKALIEASDPRFQLQLYVSLCNTFIKYITVVAAIYTNRTYFTAINRCTWHRVRLDAAFAKEGNYSKRAKEYFEFLLYFKICSLNVTIIVQLLTFFAVRESGNNGNTIRMYFELYGFVLWNYSENMADYFYYTNCNVLKYYQQLHEQLQALLRETKLLHYFRMRQQRRGTLMQLSCLLSDRVSAIHNRFVDIFALYRESFSIQKYQILSIVLNTLVTNLTNSYTLFSLLAKSSLHDIVYLMILNTIYALSFYVDTYLVTMVTEHIRLEFIGMSMTLRQFSQMPTLDVRLDQEIEHFSLKLLRCKEPFFICGFFTLDRSLIYAITATGFSYFITLVQFDFILG